MYDSTKSGWFDGRTFIRWFLEIFIKYVEEKKTQNPILIGDNLQSHFTPSVIRAAKDKGVYFTPLPPNSTHIMQPLDVAVFGLVKKYGKQFCLPGERNPEQKDVFLKNNFHTFCANFGQASLKTVSQI